MSTLRKDFAVMLDYWNLLPLDNTGLNLPTSKAKGEPSLALDNLFLELNFDS